MYQCLGARRTAGHINIHRYNMVGAFHYTICIIKERTTAGGAGAHGYYILRVGHLVVQTLKHRGHFVYYGACYNYYIGLAWSGAGYLKTETAPVVFCRSGAHHFNSAATGAEYKWPQRVRPGRSEEHTH